MLETCIHAIVRAKSHSLWMTKELCHKHGCCALTQKSHSLNSVIMHNIFYMKFNNCYHYSCRLCAFQHPTKSRTTKPFMWQHVWIKLCTWMWKWIWQHRRKCDQNVLELWTMEWKPHQLYRYKCICTSTILLHWELSRVES